MVSVTVPGDPPLRTAVMCSLSVFPSPPPSGEVTLGEFESHFLSGLPNSDIRCFKDPIAQYPNIDVSFDILRPSVSRESARNAFIESTDTAYKRTINAWHESGVLGVLEELLKNEENETTVGYWIRRITNCLLKVCNWLQSLHASVFPHLRLSSADLCAEYSEVNDWNSGIIRSLAWHPQTLKCAVALRDDSIRIFTSNNKMIPILKHRLQKEITSMAWKPYNSSILAVACHYGVLVWHIDPTSLVTRPSSSCVTVLRQKEPVTCVSWHPDGCYLVSSSAADTTMHVWDVAMETSTSLQRMGGGGVSFVRWSPDGMRLFTATSSSLFRVWEAQTWTCEKWTNLVRHCQAACWSTDGSVLLFATVDEPIIYLLNFSPPGMIKPNCVGGSKSAIPVIDLTQILVISGSDEIRVGGRVQNMMWDKTSERLAVSFKDNSELIAIFRTKLKPILEIRPLGFVRGLPTESVQTMSFHNNFKFGALLTVAWSSGRVANIPFIFVPVGIDAQNRIPLYERGAFVADEMSSVQRRPIIYSDPLLHS